MPLFYIILTIHEPMNATIARIVITIVAGLFEFCLYSKIAYPIVLINTKKLKIKIVKNINLCMIYLIT